MLKIKKHSLLLTIIPFIIIASPLIITLNTHAANSCGGVDTVLIECDEGGTGGIYHILSLVIDIFTIGVGILAVIGISWAGIQYLTAKDNTTKTTKAKKRIYEIVLGLIAYVLLWSGAQWLLPNGKLNPNQMEKSAITISVNGKQKVGITFTPKVSFEKDISDKSYSLTSSNSSIISTLSTVAKCADEGTATITAITATGEKDSTTIVCEDTDEDDNDDDDDDSPTDDSSSDKNIIATTGTQKNTKMKHNKPKTRKQTQNIIKDHHKDFYHTGKKSYKKVVLSKKGKYGSYEKYVKSLGGVFEQFADKKRIKVKTAADLQAAAEYVFGLWSIWGPDYSGWFMVKWAGNDAFYKNDPNRSNYGYTGKHKINTILSKSNNNTIDTHCNNSMHVFMSSTSLKSINTGAGKSNIKRKLQQENYYKSEFIHDIKKLKVGDLVNFETGTAAGHVAMVGEVYEDYLVMYDGGSRFMKRRNYKIKVKRNSNGSRFPSPYSGYISWYGYRPWKIDQSITLGGLN